MTTDSRYSSILMIDPDTGFKQQIQEDPESVILPPTFAHTKREARNLIEDPARHFSAIFINPKLEGLRLFNHARAHRIGVPLFMLHDPGTHPMNEADLKRLTISRRIDKPARYSEMTKLIEPTALTYDVVYGATRPGQAQNIFDLNTPDPEFKDFIPLPARNLLAGTHSFFDVYLKIDPKKIIKILNESEILPPERVLHYMQKGVAEFFIKREAYEQKLLSDPQTAITPTIMLAQVLSLGDDLLQSVGETGLTPHHIKKAEDLLLNLDSVLRSYDQKHQIGVKDFLEQVQLYDHSVAVCSMSLLLARALEMATPTHLRSIGLAALFHDIGLAGLSANIQAEKESLLTPLEIQKYHEHPLRSAQILRQATDLDEAALQAVEQHHERRDRSGFPHQLDTTQINRVADIISICDSFIKYLGDPLECSATQFQKGLRLFPEPVLKAFSQLFLPAKQDN